MTKKKSWINHQNSSKGKNRNLFINPIILNIPRWHQPCLVGITKNSVKMNSGHKVQLMQIQMWQKQPLWILISLLQKRMYRHWGQHASNHQITSSSCQIHVLYRMEAIDFPGNNVFFIIETCQKSQPPLHWFSLFSYFLAFIFQRISIEFGNSLS